MAERGLRILFLAPQPFFEVRGTPLAVLHMTRALAALGHRVDLLTFPQGEPLPSDGVRHLRSLRLPVGRVKAGPSLAKMALDVPFLAEAVARLASGRYDVVHAVEEAAHLVAPFARLLRVPLVVDVDSSIPDQLRYSGFARRGPLPWLAEALERHALRHAAAAVTVCASLTEGVKARAPRVPVFQVEDPPLADRETPPPPEAVLELRFRLDLTSVPVVLYSGNFEPYQGVELLLEAFVHLPSAQLLLMGGEPQEVEAMRARARAFRVDGRCVFSGKRPPAELPLFLALADVLASPRIRGENTPFKVYTYLASGKPIVATRIATHTQLLGEATAFLVEPQPAAFAEGLRWALGDPAEAKARADRGYALVARDYSVARYRQKIAAAYAAVEALARR
ncbi:MAG TPA: glycosyltransferase family 4 protein [Vicinamibacteria bacterium]|nr:glycosyltransferase family 4 protein [Vicinamibacteria bacterium]